MNMNGHWTYPSSETTLNHGVLFSIKE